MKKQKEVNPKYLVAGVFVIILLIGLVIYHYGNRDNGFDSYKIQKNQYIVYDLYSYQENHIPMINLKGDTISLVNQEIQTKTEAFLKESPNIVTYQYDLTGNVLSVAIQYLNLEEKEPVVSYDVYHINVYTGELYTDSDIYQMYSVSLEEVSLVVKSRFQEFYKELFEEHYFDEECDYECFLYMRGIVEENYMEDAHAYIKDGNLYIIKVFQIYSPFHEEDYFSFQDFLIQITE
ncbi:MAG: hypothetical protein J6X28_00045 [Bacilli bacterium]|nr:hypothetical protein [Bacilli bacterium]